MEKHSSCKMSVIKDWPQVRDNFQQYLDQKSVLYGNSFYIDVRLFGLKVGGFHVISNPAYVRHFLFDNYLNYFKPDYIFKLFQDFLGEYGLLTTNNDEIWRQDREIWNPAFKEQNIKKYTNSMVNQIANSLDSWQEHEQNNTAMNLDNATMTMTYNILLDTLLKGANVPFPSLRNTLRQTLASTSKAARYYGFITKPYARYQLKKATKVLVEIGDVLVANSLANNSDVNIINLLAKGYSKLHMAPDEMQKSLRAEALTILVAGHATTASLVGHICAFLSLYPIHADRVREEVFNLIGNKKPCYEDIAKLTYTQAVVNEVLRLKPSVLALVRIAKEEDSIGQYKIKKGDTVLISIPSLQRLPQYWPNPDGFNPERFLKPLGEQYKYLFIPFGLGPHSCIGQHFSNIEAVLVTAMIYQRYNLYLTSNSSLDIEIPTIFNQLNRKVTMTVHSTAQKKP